LPASTTGTALQRPSRASFPKLLSNPALCNSIKYVASKDQKDFMKDLKCVCQVVANLMQAEQELESLGEKWGENILS